MTTWTLPFCVMERFGSVDVMLGSISDWTFLGYAPVLYLGCSHGSCASHRKLPFSERQRERKRQSKGREGGRKEERGSNIVAHDMKPQMQICPCQCTAAIACKAPHSCCWCRPFTGCDKQHTHLCSSQALLLSCPPFLSKVVKHKILTIHSDRTFSVFDAK